MNILHLLTSGHPGGIEVLCQTIGKNSNWNNYFCFITDGGIIYEQMKKSKMNVLLVSDLKRIYAKFKKISSYISENDIDIVNIHHKDIYLQLYYLLLKLKFKNIKFVSTIHSCNDKIFRKNENYIKRKLKKISLKIRFKISDLHIFVSNAGYESYLNDFRIDKNKVKIVYNGIEMNNSKFELTKKNNLLYIGRVISYKGIEVLLNSIKELLNEKIDIHLDIVGDGPELNAYKQFVDNNKLNKFVTFHGFDTEKEKYYKNAKLFIYPSLCEEVFGISIVEAMSYGIPCITFNKGGIPEIISNEEDGFIVTETSSKELTNKIKYALNLDDKKIKEISNNAIKKSENFSIDNTIKSLEELYTKLLKKG